jgi:hypothetical protein
MRDTAYDVALGTNNERVGCPAHAGSVLSDSVEHRLNAGWRRRNYPKNLACCGLLLECFLRLIEQTHILNSDDGLVGEGLKERNLRVGEPAGSRRVAEIVPTATS